MTFSEGQNLVTALFECLFVGQRFLLYRTYGGFFSGRFLYFPVNSFEPIPFTLILILNLE